MTPPNAITTTNVEDEIRALRPVAVIPNVENEGSEDESSVNENLEQEGEPLGEAPEEATLVEETEEDTEEYEEVSDSSVAPLTSPTTSPASPHVDHHAPPPNSPVLRTVLPSTYHVGEPSHGTTRPRQDEPYARFAPRQRIHSPERVPRHTTPAMYSLSGDPYFPPTPPTNPSYNPDFTLQMYRELQAIRSQQNDILNRQEYLERMAAYDFDRFSFRMDRFEVELMTLRNTVREMRDRLSRLEDTNSRRRD